MIFSFIFLQCPIISHYIQLSYTMFHLVISPALNHPWGLRPAFLMPCRNPSPQPCLFKWHRQAAATPSRGSPAEAHDRQEYLRVPHKKMPWISHTEWTIVGGTIWLFNIAMERSTIFKFGKPSISMGHLYHGYVTNNQRFPIVCLGGGVNPQYEPWKPDYSSIQSWLGDQRC
jgi:hypothetical protein